MSLEIVSWLNSNGSAVTAIATIALVIATVLLVRATVFLADINTKMWQAQHRPWLYFKPGYVMGEDWIIDNLDIANAGNGPAFDIKFRIELLDPIPDIERIKNFIYNTPLDGMLDDRTITALSPDNRILLIDELANAGIRTKEIRINDFSYSDINGIRIHQSPIIIKGTMPI